VNTSKPISTPSDLLEQTPVIINVGLEGFSEEMQTRGVKVVHVDWRPPAGGDPELADLLSRLGS
jgi:FdrA protein